MDYKEIPSGALSVYLTSWWCGDDECNCRCMQIWAKFSNTHPNAPWWKKHELTGWSVPLWESTWFSGYPHEDRYNEDLEHIQQETIEACKHYGIPTLLDGDCIWDWAGELILHK